jgi:hypothetical protein
MRLAVPALLAGLSLAHPAGALAAPVEGQADDRVGDGIGGPARDLEQARTAFDPAAGRWSVTLRLAAPASTTSWAMANVGLHQGGCPGQDGAEPFAGVRTSTRPGSNGAAGSAGTYADGVQPDGSQGPAFLTDVRKTVSADGRELTVEASHPRMVGRTATCLSVSLSYDNEQQDALDPTLRLAAPAGPGSGTGGGGAGDAGSPGGATGGPAGGPPTPPAAPLRASAIALVRPAAVVRRDRSGARTVRLRAFDRALTGTATLRSPRGGATLAKASWRAVAGRPVTVRLVPTTAGRRAPRRTTVRLTVFVRAPQGVLRRTFTVRTT